ncbi:MAG TPA: SLC13 family permease [Limnochordia bacterium]|nr:SLC13 family permease [Limnochordia bacterium]
MNASDTATQDAPGRAGEARKALYLAAAVAVFVLIELLPLGRLAVGDTPLNHAGHAVIALFFLAIVLWVSEALPFAVTGLIVLLLLPLLGVTDGAPPVAGSVAPSRDVAEGFAQVVGIGFGSPIVLFTFGLMLLSAAVSRSGLGRRAVVLALAKTRATRRGVVLVFMALGAVLGMWFTAVVGAAMMAPIVRSVVGAVEEHPAAPAEQRALRIALAIACGWGPLLGGMATPAGALANLLAIEYFHQLAHIDITFGQWMAVGVPVAALLIPAGWLVLMRFYDPGAGRPDFTAMAARLPAVSAAERKTLAVFLLTAAAWLAAPVLNQLTGLALSTYWIALAGGLSLFLPGMNIAGWHESLREVDWNTLLLLASGLALGRFTYSTGAAGWLAGLIMQHVVALTPFLQAVAVLSAVAALKLLFNSTTITGVVVSPLLIHFSLTHHIDPLRLTLPAAVASSLGLILITQSLTNVIAYSTGYLSMRDMILPGLIGSVIAVPVIAAVTLAVLPWLQVVRF